MATRARNWNVTLLLDLDRGMDEPAFKHLSALWGRRAHFTRGTEDAADAPELAVTTVESAELGLGAVTRAVDGVQQSLAALPNPRSIVRVRNYLAAGVG